MMVRYSQNQDQFYKEKIEVTIWVTNLQFWVIHDLGNEFAVRSFKLPIKEKFRKKP